jgi:hypothetical protein
MEVDDEREMVNKLSQVFNDLGMAGYSLNQEKKGYVSFINLASYDIKKNFKKYGIFNNKQGKMLWYLPIEN